MTTRRQWTIPTLAARFEDFINERGLSNTSTVEEVRQEFKDAVWEQAIAKPAPPVKKTKAAK